MWEYFRSGLLKLRLTNRQQQQQLLERAALMISGSDTLNYVQRNPLPAYA